MRRSSIMILGDLVLAACFYVVVMLAEGLPVVLVPKQNRITTVRYDMVNDFRLHIPALPGTDYAERVDAEIGLGQFPPAGAIAAG